MITHQEALERILSYVNLDEYDYETSGVGDAERLLREVLTPPTAEEVCEALSEFMGREVSYTNKQFHYTIKDTQVLMFVTETYDNNTFSLGVYLPPHLITLIGKFYEGEIK